MNFSYWELKNWFTDIDYTIVGSGIVGLNCALALREKFPESKILILEKGILPQGASTKNAGFACFGSISEIIDDLKSHSEEEVIQLISKRWSGLQLLRNNLGDETIDFKPYGGYELFLTEDESTYNECLQKLPFINELLKPLFRNDVFAKEVDRFAFHGIKKYIFFNPFEAQIDTGKMMNALLQKAIENNILILNQLEVTSYHDTISKNTWRFSTKLYWIYSLSHYWAKLFRRSGGNVYFSKRKLIGPNAPVRIRSCYLHHCKCWNFSTVNPKTVFNMTIFSVLLSILAIAMNVFVI